jgi:hypothetical protein
MGKNGRDALWETHGRERRPLPFRAAATSRMTEAPSSRAGISQNRLSPPPSTALRNTIPSINSFSHPGPGSFAGDREGEDDGFIVVESDSLGVIDT